MDKEELLKILKEHLEISVETVSHETGYCKPDSYSIKVSILLYGEVISESESDTL